MLTLCGVKPLVTHNAKVSGFKWMYDFLTIGGFGFNSTVVNEIGTNYLGQKAVWIFDEAKFLWPFCCW